MKKYVKPTMESEVFVSNEFIAACYGCINMNGIKAVYKDLDGDGILDKIEESDSNKLSVGEMNDCDRDGSNGIVAHRLTDAQVDAAQKVILVYGNGKQVSSFTISGNGKEYPHFADIYTNASN